jgi:hypothetical protein
MTREIQSQKRLQAEVDTFNSKVPVGGADADVAFAPGRSRASYEFVLHVSPLLQAD